MFFIIILGRSLKNSQVFTFCLFICLFFFFLSFLLPGEFADVYKGTLQTPKGKEIVAIKVLRVSIMFGAYYFLAQKLRHAIVCEYLFDPYLSNKQPSKSKAPISRPFHSRIFNSLEVLKGFFSSFSPAQMKRTRKIFCQKRLSWASLIIQM